MTTGLVTVEEDAPTECVAILLERREVGRVPVVRHGSLFGIVPRADLTRMKLASSDEVHLDQAPPDGAPIGRYPLARVDEQPWVNPFATFVEVEGKSQAAW